MFDKIEKIGIYIDDRAYNFFSVLTTKLCKFKKFFGFLHGRDIHYIHIPIPVGLCKNILGYTNPAHIQIKGSPQDMVEKMVSLQLQHQEKASSNFLKLNEKIEFSKLENIPILRAIEKEFEEYCDFDFI